MLQIKTNNTEIYPDLIERIWIVNNTEKATDLMVPPNQYVNVVFPLNNSSYSHNGVWIREPQIEGLSLQTTYLHYPKDTKLIGIRFYPHGLYSFVSINGNQIINNSVDFSQLTKGTTQKISIKNDEAISDIYSLLTELFKKNNYEKSKIIRDYYQYFRGNNSMITINEFCKTNNTNYTSLNRLFSRIIGISPKQFERLIKFRKTLCSIIDSSENLTEIGIASGYFDQAHFIREFKLFLDATPSAYQALIKSADKKSNIINYNFRLF